MLLQAEFYTYRKHYHYCNQQLTHMLLMINQSIMSHNSCKMNSGRRNDECMLTDMIRKFGKMIKTSKITSDIKSIWFQITGLFNPSLFCQCKEWANCRKSKQNHPPKSSISMPGLTMPNSTKSADCCSIFQIQLSSSSWSIFGTNTNTIATTYVMTSTSLTPADKCFMLPQLYFDGTNPSSARHH